MALFTPIYMKSFFQYGTVPDEKGEKKACRKVEGMKSGKKLCRVARKAPSSEVRLEAVRNLHLTDREVLADAAAHDRNLDVRYAAIRRLAAMGEEETLMRLAMSDSRESDDKKTAKAAASYISDEARLTEIIRNAPSKEARAGAASEVKNEEVLMEAARASEDSELQRQAVLRIDDEEFLTEIALKSSSADVEITVLRKLSDPARLWRLVTEAEDVYCRERAAERLIDMTDNPVQLAKIANLPLGDSYIMTKQCWKAAVKLSRIAPGQAIGILVRLMKERPEEYVDSELRRQAVSFLEKQYRSAAASEGSRKLIRSLPDGLYGEVVESGCYTGGDRTHFDLS